MADCVREQLLGYLLGALEESERAWLEEKLADDPELRKELALVRLELESLRCRRHEFDVPFGLATRTCECIFSHADGVGEPDAPFEEDPTPVASPSRSVAAAVPAGSWSLVDLGVAAGIVIAATLLIFPAIANSRYNADVLACQNNMWHIGLAMQQYSQNNGGYFPAVPVGGQWASPDSFAFVLLGDCYLDDAGRVNCPGTPVREPGFLQMPMVDDRALTKAPEEIYRLRRAVGGDYGYCLGYMENGRYRVTRNLHRPHFALVADAPSLGMPEHRSLNHAGTGQNVLFETGRVVFLKSPRSAGYTDNFYVNDSGAVAAGRHRNDSVIAAGTSILIGRSFELFRLSTDYDRRSFGSSTE